MASLFLWLFDQLFYGKVPPTPRGGFGREGLHYRFRDKELGLGIVNYFKGYQMQTGPTFTIHIAQPFNPNAHNFSLTFVQIAISLLLALNTF